MFFALDLIESYGSGIRRAKDAMDRNGSPKLIFEPLEDKGDYTMVTAYISKEFAAIQNIESKNNFKIHLSPLVKNIDKFNYWLDTIPFYINVEKEGVLLN